MWATSGPEGAAPGAGNVGAVAARVCNARDKLGLSGEIVPFGSFVNGFSTASSDCDLSYMPVENSATETPVMVLRQFANELPKHGFTGIICIFQALIPLIKAIDPSGIEVDLCVGNRLGQQNSKLVAAYCQLDARVGEVGRLVKQWAKAWELIGCSDGHLTSYAYTLLTIYYLMHTQPPVVPNLQDLATQYCDPVIVKDSRWGREIPWDCKFWSDVQYIHRSQNTEGVQELLGGFFRFYASAFDWGQHAVSIRTALRQGPTSKTTLHCAVTKDQWYVEDPFDLRHNLASQCTREGRKRILGKMNEALEELSKPVDNVLDMFASHCHRVQTKFMLKCRVHLEKVSFKDFAGTFTDVRGVEPFKVWYPASPGPRMREVMDAFLSFQTEADRREVHRLNETWVCGWQLRLLPCSTWALDDALMGGGYEEREVTPEASSPMEAEDTEHGLGDKLAEEARSDFCVTQAQKEVTVLIERVQAMGLPDEDRLARAKLEEYFNKEKEELTGATSSEPEAEETTAAVVSIQEEAPTDEFRFQ